MIVLECNGEMYGIVEQAMRNGRLYDRISKGRTVVLEEVVR